MTFGSQWEQALAWLSQHESLLIFLAILLEECGVPMPMPADLAMALAGYRVAQGEMSLLEAFIIGQAATLIGSSVLYWVGRRGGRALLFRYGRILHLNAHRIAQVERLVTRLGPWSVIIGRQVPGLRLAAPLACGVFRVPFKLFLPAMFVGASIYIGIFIVIGMWGGPAALSVVRHSGLPLRFLATTALLIVAAVLLRQLSRRAREVISPVHRLAASRRRSLEAALIAGLGASALTALFLAWLLELVGLVTQATPERALLQLLESDPTPALIDSLSQGGAQRLLFAGIVATLPLQFAIHFIWALLYGFVVEPRLRGRAATRGFQFSLLPWLFSSVVVFPLLGAGLFGLNVSPLLLVGELVRNAIFGVSLATIYRLVRLARQPRMHDGQRHGHRHQLGVQVPLPGPLLAGGAASHDTAFLQRVERAEARAARDAGG